MRIAKHFKIIQFNIAKIERYDVILGLPWIEKYNLMIN